MTDWTTTAARPHESRLRLDTYPVVDVVQARYGDMDANGHLNNLALESLHENARATMNRSLFPDIYDVATRRLRLVTSQNAVHFLAEAHWPALIHTGAGRRADRSHLVRRLDRTVHRRQLHRRLRHRAGPVG